MYEVSIEQLNMLIYFLYLFPRIAAFLFQMIFKISEKINIVLNNGGTRVKH